MPRRKILVVDDEVDVVELLGFRLKTRGYDVLKAYGGEEGFGLARGEKPDLILPDILLPDVSGIDICRRLKSDPQLQGIPVILISASVTQINEAKRMGRADGILQKPFEPEELFRTIAPYLKAA